TDPRSPRRGSRGPPECPTARPSAARACVRTTPRARSPRPAPEVFPRSRSGGPRRPSRGRGGPPRAPHASRPRPGTARQRPPGLRDGLHRPALALAECEFLHELDRVRVLLAGARLHDAVGERPRPDVPAELGADHRERPAVRLPEPPEGDVRVLGREVGALRAPGAREADRKSTRL